MHLRPEGRAHLCRNSGLRAARPRAIGPSGSFTANERTYITSGPSRPDSTSACPHERAKKHERSAQQAKVHLNTCQARLSLTPHPPATADCTGVLSEAWRHKCSHGTRLQTRVHMHTYPQMYARAHTRRHTHTHTCTRTRTRPCICVHAHMHA